MQAWLAIHRLNRSQMGKKLDFVHGSYTQWVINRAPTYGMPYPLTRVPSSLTPTPSPPILFETKEEFQYQLIEMTRERDTWRMRH